MLPEGYLNHLCDWSDEWLRITKPSGKWKYQGSDIHLSGIRYRSRRFPDLPGDKTIDVLIEHPSEIMRSLQLEDLTSGGTFQIISKPANAPALYWHQDWTRWDDPVSMSPWPQQVFLNWYLRDTNKANGCLRVIPGSHLHRVDLHEHLVPAHEGGGYDIQETNEWMFCDHPAAVDVPVAAGQLVIADGRLLHGSIRTHQPSGEPFSLAGFTAARIVFRKAGTDPCLRRYSIATLTCHSSGTDNREGSCNNRVKQGSIPHDSLITAA